MGRTILCGIDCQAVLGGEADRQAFLGTVLFEKVECKKTKGFASVDFADGLEGFVIHKGIKADVSKKGCE